MQINYNNYEQNNNNSIEFVKNFNLHCMKFKYSDYVESKLNTLRCNFFLGCWKWLLSYRIRSFRAFLILQSLKQIQMALQKSTFP